MRVAVEMHSVLEFRAVARREAPNITPSVKATGNMARTVHFYRPDDSQCARGRWVDVTNLSTGKRVKWLT